MKKTKKYYRDEIAKSYDCACIVIREAVEKYGPKCDTRGWRDCPIEHVSNGRNGEIEGFSIVKKIFYVDIYWQGDSTDGEDSVSFFRDGVELASVWSKDTQSLIHDNVKFNKQQLYEAMVNFSTRYLQ